MKCEEKPFGPTLWFVRCANLPFPLAEFSHDVNGRRGKKKYEETQEIN